MSRALPSLFVVILAVACARGEQPTTTPTPTATADPVSLPPPSVQLRLGPQLQVTVADGRCIELGDREICGDGTLEPRDLCEQPLSDGWILPADALMVPNATVELEIDSAVASLSAGATRTYFFPGETTTPVHPMIWVARSATLDDTALATLTRSVAALESELGPPRRPIVILDQATVAGTVTRGEPLTTLMQAWLEPSSEWWTRGLADYLALSIEHRAGVVAGQAAYDELIERYQRHRDHPEASPSSARGPIAADVGALVAYCADVELRTRSSSLGAFLKPMEVLHPDAFTQALQQDHAELAADHAGRVRRRGVIELDGCLRRAGRKLTAHHIPAVDPARLLRIRSFDQDTLEVEQEGSGPLRSGDVLQHIRGQTIRRAWDIVFYLRDLSGRHRFSVSVQRGERTIRTWLRMVSLDDDLPVQVRFRASEDPEADPEGDPFRGLTDRRH